MIFKPTLGFKNLKLPTLQHVIVALILESTVVMIAVSSAIVIKHISINHLNCHANCLHTYVVHFEKDTCNQSELVFKSKFPKLS